MLSSLGCGATDRSEAQADEAERTEEAPERAEEVADEAAEGTGAGAVRAASEAGAPSEERLEEPPGQPPNFLATYHCVKERAPCTIRFGRLRTVQRVDLGSGHRAAPRVHVDLSVESGRASIGTLSADESNAAEGDVASLERASMEGGAYYLEVEGDASGAELTIRFAE